jgi:hypothetical protein
MMPSNRQRAAMSLKRAVDRKTPRRGRSPSSAPEPTNAGREPIRPRQSRRPTAKPFRKSHRQSGLWLSAPEPRMHNPHRDSRRSSQACCYAGVGWRRWRRPAEHVGLHSRHLGFSRTQGAGAGGRPPKWMPTDLPITCRQPGARHTGHRDRAGQWPGGAGRRRRRCGQPAARPRCGGRLMIPVPAGVRVWLATGHTDMRCGFPGASARPASPSRSTICSSAGRASPVSFRMAGSVSATMPPSERCVALPLGGNHGCSLVPSAAPTALPP